MAELVTAMKGEKIGIVGSGLIGRSWAMLFAGAGYNVVIFDVESEQVNSGLEDIKNQFKELEKSGLLRGSMRAEQQYNLVTGCSNLSDCVKGAKYIQECVPENVDLKRKVWHQIDQLCSESTILASSTSCIRPALFTNEMKHRHNFIVAHPANPPYFVPIIELVPAPWTNPEVIAMTKVLMEELGQDPIVVKKDIDGFASNRIQYSILNECWRLVENDIISVADVDKVMSWGLGMHYAFLGPLETAYLNADGLLSFCDHYGSTICQVSSTFGETPEWSSVCEGAKKIQEELNKIHPMEKIEESRRVRNMKLVHLAQLKKKFQLEH